MNRNENEAESFAGNFMAFGEEALFFEVPLITVKKAPPPDYKEWEGKPDKLQYFSPNPGAGH